ncbi:ribosome maturation protein SBDS [Cucurbita maxima]|uniref:Ribosome maturation protein SBDS n=1 Tax=Cucurbita maxima TaxID=3661 RepID=A0A6J1IK36_CUCMA|nr:ribosome maturation protein SBDS [Cucurbita maxima]
MSRSLVQPIGQKRLTNVAVVRLKRHGLRFEIACYKNKVLSWRSGVEKDLDEVLQSQIVYSNVSKGVLAKTKDLKAAFDTDDQAEICLKILKEGELQIAGKEREAQLSNQFRDIATIVMQKTFNPETKRPYTISMIERLMREIHFAVDPNHSSKKQALEVIHELQKQFPIKRSPMRIRYTVPEQNFPSLLDKLNSWSASIISNDQSGNQQRSVICELDPSFYRDCNPLMSELQGKFEVLSFCLHEEGDTNVDQYDDDDFENVELPPRHVKESESAIPQLSEALQKQAISVDGGNTQKEGKRCSTCNVVVGDAIQFREHHKSEWHKHNIKRKTKNLPPLTEEECMVEIAIGDSESDLKEYSF